MIPERDRVDENFLASWYVHVLGNELQAMTITPDTVDRITRKGMSVVSSLPDFCDEFNTRMGI